MVLRGHPTNCRVPACPRRTPLPTTHPPRSAGVTWGERRIACQYISSLFVLTALARQGPSGAVQHTASPDDSGVDSVDAGLLAHEMQQAIAYGHGQAHVPAEVASLYRLFARCNA